MSKYYHNLRDFLRRHIRIVKAALVGLFLWGSGFGLFYYLAIYEGKNKFLVSIFLSPLMTAVGLILNRLLAWKDRKTAKKRYVRRWSMKWAVMFGLSQSSFILLAGSLGLPALPVRGGSAVPLSYISYRLNNEWVFRELEREETEKA